MIGMYVLGINNIYPPFLYPSHFSSIGKLTLIINRLDMFPEKKNPFRIMIVYIDNTHNRPSMQHLQSASLCQDPSCDETNIGDLTIMTGVRSI
jgi:hypothetical protein